MQGDHDRAACFSELHDARLDDVAGTAWSIGRNTGVDALTKCLSQSDERSCPPPRTRAANGADTEDSDCLGEGGAVVAGAGKYDGAAMLSAGLFPRGRHGEDPIMPETVDDGTGNAAGLGDAAAVDDFEAQRLAVGLHHPACESAEESRLTALANLVSITCHQRKPPE